MTPAQLQEKAIGDLVVAQLEALGWTLGDGLAETFGAVSTWGRTSNAQHVLPRRLREALEALNPGLPTEALTAAYDVLLRDRGAMTPARANQEVYGLLRDGVPVAVKGADSETETVRVRQA